MDSPEMLMIGNTFLFERLFHVILKKNLNMIVIFLWLFF